VGSNEIVFSSNEGGDRELYKTVASGSGVARLTKNKVDDANPSWSPDGSMVAFTRTYPGPKSEIWVMRQDGTQPRLVLALGATYAFDADLSWSPEGKRLLYSQDGIFVVNLDGSGNSKLVGPEGSGPEWSPDGTRIVFSKSPTGTTTSENSDPTPLWTMNPDGSGQEKLTDPSDASGGKVDSSPTWTPDGNQIAFVRGNGLGVFAGDTAQVRTNGIFLINADGSGLLRVSEGRGEFDPSSSPSGDQFVYVGGDDGTGDGDLYLIRADGSGKTRLTTGGRSASPDWRWPPS
jgi:Tol biopolymer transport system component